MRIAQVSRGEAASSLGSSRRRADHARSRRLSAAVAATSAAALVGAGASVASAQVAHRYSFSEPAGAAPVGTVVADTVGGANFNGTIQGGPATLTGTQLTLPGGDRNTTAYVDVREQTDELFTGADATFEIWGTYAADGGGWERAFDFGNDPDNYWFFSPKTGNGTTRLEFKNGTAPAALQIIELPGTPFADGNQQLMTARISGNGTAMALYRNGLLVGSRSLAGNGMLDIVETNDYLGRSQFNDPNLKGSLNEARTYNNAISSATVLLNYTLGPDVLTATTNTFTAPGTANYNDAGNWSAGAVPGTNQLALINGAGANATVSTTTTFAHQVRINSGALTVNGGATYNASGGVDLAPTAGNTATINLNGGGTLVTAVFADGESTTTGSGNKVINFDNGTLRLIGTSGLGGTNVSGTLGAGGGTIDTNGANFLFGGSFSGAGALNKTGAGILTLQQATNTYAGGTNVSGGLVAFAGAGSFGGGNINLAGGGGLQWAAGNAADLSTKTITLNAGGGTFDTNGNDVTLANPVGNNGAGALIKAGDGTLTLRGANTYTGATQLNGGLVNFAALNNLGTGTAVNFGGGGIQYTAGSAGIDITTARAVTLGAGGGTVDTNGQNVTLAGNVAGAALGPFTKLGAGTLNRTAGTMNPTNLFVRAGTLDLSGGTITTGQYSSIGQLGGDNGTLTIRNGGRVVAGDFDFNVSDLDNSTGTVTVEGVGTNAATADLAIAGTFFLSKHNGAVANLNLKSGYVNKTGGAPVVIGQGTGAVGTVTQTGGTFNVTDGEFWVGNEGDATNFGTGTFTKSAGQTNVNNWFAVGRFGAKGTFNFSGGTLEKTGGGNSYVGQGAQPSTADVSGTAVWNVNGGELWFGEAGTGTLTLRDTAAITVNNYAVFGRNGGTGFGNIQGGTFTKTGDGGNHLIIGAGNNSKGTLTQTGGAVVSTLSDTWMGEGDGSVAVWNISGGSANLSRLDVGFNGSGSGTLTVSGNALMRSTAIVLGNANTAVGTVNLQGGTLSADTIAPGGSSITTRTFAFTGGTLDVDNFSLVGGLANGGTGRLAPGGVGVVGPTAISAGGYTQAAGASAAIDIASLASFDVVTVAGATTLAGTFAIDVLGAFAPANGATFDVLNVTGGGTISGLPALGGPDGGLFAASLVNGNSTLRLTAVPEPASVATLAIGAAGLLMRRRR